MHPLLAIETEKQHTSDPPAGIEKTTELQKQKQRSYECQGLETTGERLACRKEQWAHEYLSRL